MCVGARARACVRACALALNAGSRTYVASLAHVVSTSRRWAERFQQHTRNKMTFAVAGRVRTWRQKLTWRHASVTARGAPLANNVASGPHVSSPTWRHHMFQMPWTDAASPDLALIHGVSTWAGPPGTHLQNVFAVVSDTCTYTGAPPSVSHVDLHGSDMF